MTTNPTDPTAHTTSPPAPPRVGHAVPRRRVLGLGLAAAVAVPAITLPAHAEPARSARVDAVAELERRYDLTIGLYAADLGDSTGRRELRHRDDQRFPICSVFKGFAAAAVLRDRIRSDRQLDRRLHWRESDVVDNSPITGARVADGMTIAEVCDAALRYSDNTAGNLLLGLIGGPGGVTRFARSIGDRRTRLDRWETELNSATPGDVRDTTTPGAAGASYAQLLVGSALDPGDRWLLRAWMQGNTTSATRFRAGLPAGWTLADKTGGGEYAVNNEVGIAWSPGGTPLLIAAFTRSDDPDRTTDNEVMVDLARLAVQRLT